MVCEYCGTEHPGPDVWHCGCRAAAKRQLAALTKERDEAATNYADCKAALSLACKAGKQSEQRIAALEKALLELRRRFSPWSQNVYFIDAALAGGGVEVVSHEKSQL